MAPTGTLAWLTPILNCDELDPTDTLLMLALANHVDENDETFVGIGRLAAAARCSYPTAKRRLASLEQRGFLNRDRRRRGDGNLSTYTTVLNRQALGLMMIPDPDEPEITQVSPDQRSPGRSLTRDHPDDPAELPSRELPSEEPPSSNPSSPTPADDDEYPEEVRELTREFAQWVSHNGHKLPAKGSKAARSWLREMDLLLRRGAPGDGEDPTEPDEVREVMRWALSVSDFWPANLRSVPKFRKQYTTLRAQMRRDNGRGGRRGGQLADRYAQAADSLRSRA